MRAPVPVGSLAELVLAARRATTASEVNDVFRRAADTNRYRGILDVSDNLLVSADIIGHPRAAMVDLTLTQVRMAPW